MNEMKIVKYNEKLKAIDNYFNNISAEEWERINEKYLKKELKEKERLEKEEKEREENYKKSLNEEPGAFELKDSEYVEYGVYNHTIKQMLHLRGVCYCGMPPVWFKDMTEAEEILCQAKEYYPPDHKITIITKMVTERYIDTGTTFENVIRKED